MSLLRNGVVVQGEGGSTQSMVEGEKVEYIPLEYAQKKINKLVSDYGTLKAHYEEHISQLNDFHMKTNKEMKDYYENFIRDLKKKALEHLRIVKKDKELLDASLNQEIKRQEVEIEHLRDVVANNANEYQDSLKRLTAQYAAQEEGMKRRADLEQDGVIAKYLSTAFVSDMMSQVEMDALKASKNAKIDEIVRDYEGKISATLLDSKGEIDRIASEFERKEKSRAECSRSLQEVLFAVESDYIGSITHQFEDVYETMKEKEVQYKAELNEKVATLVTSLIDTKKEGEQELMTAKLQRIAEEQALEERLQAESEGLKRQVGALESELVHAKAEAQSSSYLQRGLQNIGGLHYSRRFNLCCKMFVFYVAVQQLHSQHEALTAQLMEKYELKTELLRKELVRMKEITPSSVEGLALQSKEVETVQALQEEHAALTEQLITSYENKVSLLKSESKELENASNTSQGFIFQIPSAEISLHSASPAGGFVSDSALLIQKNLTLAAEKENRVLQEKVMALEKRLSDLMRMPSKKFGSAPDLKKLSTEGVLEKGQEVASVADKEEPSRNTLVDSTSEGMSSEGVPGHEKSPLEDVFSEEAANKVIEELEEEVFSLRLELQNLEMENQSNLNEKVRLGGQLEALIKEKRTDVVAAFEDEIKTLRSELSLERESMAELKEEKLRNESKIRELKERSEKAEAELKDRDEAELAKLNPADEKTQLKTTVSKQREDIIMKSKAATAGWVRRVFSSISSYPICLN